MIPATTAFHVALILRQAHALTLARDDDRPDTHTSSFADKIPQGGTTSWERAEQLARDHEKQVATGVAGRTPLIVVNNYYNAEWKKKDKCAYNCSLSQQSRDLFFADALVWNFCNPDPKFGVTFESMPAKLRHQRWVFNFDYEPGNAFQWWCGSPWDFRKSIRENAKNFDWTMTFSPESDIHRPMFRMIPLATPVYEYRQKDWSQGREKLVLWFVSKCDSKRLYMGRRLQKLLPPGQMDIFGDCGEPSPCETGQERSEWDQCHTALFAQYKFYAAFENSRCSGYTTEKWARAMWHDLVPIIWGGHKRSDYEVSGLPSDSFIYLDDYRTMEDLAESIKKLGADTEAYNSFHRWRATHMVADRMDVVDMSYCDLCAKLHEDNGSPPSATARDLANWWMVDTCARPTNSSFP